MIEQRFHYSMKICTNLSYLQHFLLRKPQKSCFSFDQTGTDVNAVYDLILKQCHLFVLKILITGKKSMFTAPGVMNVLIYCPPHVRYHKVNHMLESEEICTWIILKISHLFGINVLMTEKGNMLADSV